VKRMLVPTALVAVGAIALAVVLVSGGGSSSSKPEKSVRSTSAAAAASPTVILADTALGKILVAADGRTLYEFDHDTPTMATCTGACTTLWLPLTTSATLHAGPGVDRSKLAILSGPNGNQVTYNGHPLYRFAQDHAPGDMLGEGFAGGIWWVLGADGQKVTPTAATPTTAGTQPQHSTSGMVTSPPTSPSSGRSSSSPTSPPTSPPTTPPTSPPKSPPTTDNGGGGVAF
jgi:predicted lipoprotein with Yx(FWY)xxD motif